MNVRQADPELGEPHPVPRGQPHAHAVDELGNGAPHRDGPTVQQGQGLPRDPGQPRGRGIVPRPLALGRGRAPRVGRPHPGRLAVRMGGHRLDADGLRRRHGGVPLLHGGPPHRDAPHPARGREHLRALRPDGVALPEDADGRGVRTEAVPERGGLVAPRGEERREKVRQSTTTSCSTQAQWMEHRHTCCWRTSRKAEVFKPARQYNVENIREEESSYDVRATWEPHAGDSPEEDGRAGHEGRIVHKDITPGSKRNVAGPANLDEGAHR